MDNLIIRKATLNDLETILLLSDGLTLADLPYDKEVDVNWAHTEVGKKFYEDKIKEETGVCFVAEMDNKIVGYFVAGRKDVASYRYVKVAELENIFVLEGYRSKGVGKKLMEAFKNWAKDLRVDKIAVSAFALNEKGIAFYKREGFLPQDLTLEMHLK